MWHTIFIQSNSHNNLLRHKKKPDNLKIKTIKNNHILYFRPSFNILNGCPHLSASYFWGGAGMM
jgi:hypothetical protein